MDMSISVARTEEKVGAMQEQMKVLPQVVKQSNEAWEAVYGEGKIRYRVGNLERWRVYVAGAFMVIIVVAGFVMKAVGF